MQEMIEYWASLINEENGRLNEYQSYYKVASDKSIDYANELMRKLDHKNYETNKFQYGKSSQKEVSIYIQNNKWKEYGFDSKEQYYDWAAKNKIATEDQVKLANKLLEQHFPRIKKRYEYKKMAKKQFVDFFLLCKSMGIRTK